jgi:hypothetical protein
MSVNAPFNPHYGSGRAVTTGASSASIEIGEGSKSLVLTNAGANPCYVRTGDSSVTAVDIVDYLLLAGAQVSISKPQDHTHLAYLQSGASTTLHVIAGEGY